MHACAHPHKHSHTYVHTYIYIANEQTMFGKLDTWEKKSNEENKLYWARIDLKLRICYKTGTAGRF